MIGFNSTFYKYATLPIGSPNNIGDYPGPTAQGKLTLSGALVESDGTVNFDKNNFSSSLSITTPIGNNLSGVKFTIIGYNNGIYTTEIIAGPSGGNTVNTNNLFTKILQVSISVNVNAPFSLGSYINLAVRLVIPSNIGTYSTNIAYFALRSKDAPAPWQNNDSMVYANLSTENSLLLSANLQYATAKSNYFLLAGGTSTITNVNLLKGFTANISVVASELIFFIAGGASRTSESVIELGFRII